MANQWLKAQRKGKASMSDEGFNLRWCNRCQKKTEHDVKTCVDCTSREALSKPTRS
jgi:hypothetical protein